MLRKAGLLIGILTVVSGFAMPAMASAAPAITSVPGTLAPVKSEVVAKNIGGAITLTSPVLGAITCEEVVWSTKLSKNNGVEFEGEAGAEGKGENCANGEKSAVVSDWTITNFKSTVTGEGTLSFSVKVVIGGELKCTYTGTNVKFTYGFGGSTILFNKAAGVTSPVCGIAPIDGVFALSIGGILVTLD